MRGEYFMKPIESVLEEIIINGISQEVLSSDLCVSPSSVNRWVNSKSVPRPELERKIRIIHKNLYQKKNENKEHDKIIGTLDSILLELRELLHRRGRISSRNEALDQLSSLLFCHAMSIMHGGEGISKSISPENNFSLDLKYFVETTLKSYLPITLSSEMSWENFQLKIGPSENLFAKEIIEIFEKHETKIYFSQLKNFEGIDLLNDIFGKFLANSFIDEKELGQYLTPSEVVSPMIELALNSLSSEELEILCHPEKCKEFGYILDPSLGVGSFLIELVKVLYKKVVYRYGELSALLWIKNMSKYVLVGIDKSERMIKLSLTNMLMYGIEPINIHLANSLASEGAEGELVLNLKGKVRLILTNPPFGAEFAGNDLKGFNIAQIGDKNVSKVISELLFLERYLDWLCEHGQALVIIPDNVLTNKGIYKSMRELLKEKITIKSIISLPTETFSAAGTTTKTSIFHFKKIVHTLSNDTYFAICDKIGFLVNSKGNNQKSKVYITQNDFDRVLEDYSGLPSFGRFVKNVENQDRWDANYHISLPITLMNRLLNPDPTDLFLKDVAFIANDRDNPTRRADEFFSYIEISDINSETFAVNPKLVKCEEAPSRARKVVQSGDILFSTVRPDRRTVGIITREEDKAICTTGLAVIRPKNIDTMTLASLLKSDIVIAQIMRHNTGIAYPVIDEECLNDVLLPIQEEDLTKFKVLTEELQELDKIINEKRRLFNNNISIVTENWTDTKLF
jgi:type I restriction-modification system DNA methylase subunit